MRLEGKVALISGGARGQGGAESRLFAREGAKVVIGDVLEEDGRKAEAEINESGGEAVFVKLDVTKSEDWRSAVEATVNRFGKLNVLVNNAAIFGPLGRVEDITEEVWDQYMAIDAKGVFLGCKYAIPEMRKAGGGSIINIASGAAIRVRTRVPTPYAAAKGAVRAITKTVAIEYATEGIRVNTVHPGPTLTEGVMLMDPAGPHVDATDVPDWVKYSAPMGRWGKPIEIAHAALFLASDDASFVLGTELDADGGHQAR